MRKLKVSWKTVREQVFYGVGSLALGSLFISFSFQEYIQISTLTFGLVFMTIGCFLIFMLLDFPTYRLSDNQLIISSVLKTSVIDISSITEVKRVAIGDKNKMLVVVAGNKQYGISNDQTKEFNLIENLLNDLTIDDTKSNKLIDKVIWIGVAVILFPIIAIASLHLMSDKPMPKNINDLTQHEIVLLKKPTTTGRKSSKDREFISSKSPDFRFLIDSDYLSKKEMSQIDQGDTIVLYINKYDFDTKIERSNKPTWIDKHLNWSVIRVYGIEKDEELIVDPESTL